MEDNSRCLIVIIRYAIKQQELAFLVLFEVLIYFEKRNSLSTLISTIQKQYLS